MFKYKNYITINGNTYQVSNTKELPSDNIGYDKYVTYITTNNYNFRDAYNDIKEIMDDNSCNKEEWEKNHPLSSYHSLVFDEKRNIYIYTLMSIDYEYTFNSEDI